MTKKVLGLRIKDFSDSIKLLKNEENKDDGTKFVLRKDVIRGIREILEVMIKDSVPVVSVECVEKFIEKLERTRHVDTATIWFQDLKRVLLLAFEKEANKK